MKRLAAPSKYTGRPWAADFSGDSQHLYTTSYFSQDGAAIGTFRSDIVISLVKLNVDHGQVVYAAQLNCTNDSLMMQIDTSETDMLYSACSSLSATYSVMNQILKIDISGTRPRQVWSGYYHNQKSASLYLTMLKFAFTSTNVYIAGNYDGIDASG